MIFFDEMIVEQIRDSINRIRIIIDENVRNRKAMIEHLSMALVILRDANRRVR